MPKGAAAFVLCAVRGVSCATVRKNLGAAGASLLSRSACRPLVSDPMFRVARAKPWIFGGLSSAVFFLAVAAAAPSGEGSAAPRRAPITDGVLLNIGLNCQWQRTCMAAQQAAMDRALKYVRKARPASWRIQMCNRNAARSRYRVDWVGFNNCIRNASLRPAPPRPISRKRRPNT